MFNVNSALLIGVELIYLILGILLGILIFSKTSINKLLSIGLGITTYFALSILFLGWITTFGIPINWLVSTIHLSMSFLLLLYFSRNEIKRIIKITNLKSPKNLEILFVILVFTAVAIVNSQFGDLGWDSNAYHLPLAYELTINSAIGWDAATALGYYTFFAPYGVHALFAESIAITGNLSSVTAVNSVFAMALVFVVSGITKQITNSVYLSRIAGLATIGVPTVLGQVGHNYIDLATGTFWISSAIILIHLLLQKLNYVESKNRILIAISIILISASTASKTHQILQIIPVVVLLCIVLFRYRGKISGKFILFIPLSLALGFFPYFRNFTEYGNPIFPISNKLFNSGNISLSEFSGMFDSFKPSLFETGLVPIDSIIIWPFLAMLKIMAANIGFLYDPNRADLNFFTYDSTTSGAGAIFTTFNVVAILFLIWGSAKALFSKKVDMQKDLNKFSFILATLSGSAILLTPGNFWPRYILGPSILFALALFIFIGGKIRKSLIIFMGVFVFLASIYGFFRYYDYETSRFENRSGNIYGLNGELPINFIEKCDKVIVLEPRPVFTSLIGYANCAQIEHKSYEELMSNLNSIDENTWLVATKEVLECNNNNVCKFFDYMEKSKSIKIQQRTLQKGWFDDKGDYATVLVKLGVN